MYESWKMPKLQKANLKAAYDVCWELRDVKFLSDKSFKDSIRDSKGTPWQMLPQNFNNIEVFLIKHGMVTMEKINGLVCWAATQKCFRAKSENWFMEFQYITNEKIQEALVFQKINNAKGIKALELEAKKIADFLGLKGDVSKRFQDEYYGICERCDVDEMPQYKDRGILNPIDNIKEIKIK